MADKICGDGTSTDIWRHILTFLIIVIIVLLFNNRGHCYSKWEVIRLAIILTLMLIIYYIIRKKEYPFIKYVADVLMAIIFYQEGYRMLYGNELCDVKNTRNKIFGNIELKDINSSTLKNKKNSSKLNQNAQTSLRNEAPTNKASRNEAPINKAPRNEAPHK